MIIRVFFHDCVYIRTLLRWYIAFVEILKSKFDGTVLLEGVTVVIVTYRRPNFLARIMKQLEKQTVKPLEMIIIDNDPLESSKLVVEKFKLTTTIINVRYFQNQVNSLTRGRNLGVSHVKTEYTCLLDDDIEIEVDFLSKLLENIFTFVES
jgi:glycosyltransferase involved in cell wall biosynthesis